MAISETYKVVKVNLQCKEIYRNNPSKIKVKLVDSEIKKINK